MLPLVLMGSYGIAALEEARGNVREAYRALTAAKVDLRLAREERNDLQAVIHEILKAYRLRLPTIFYRRECAAR